jgi:hypothetical protein
VKAHFEDQASAGGEGWLVPAAAASAQFLGPQSEEDRRWVLPRLTPHPVRTFLEATRLGSDPPPVARRTSTASATSRSGSRERRRPKASPTITSCARGTTRW